MCLMQIKLQGFSTTHISDQPNVSHEPQASQSSGLSIEQAKISSSVKLFTGFEEDVSTLLSRISEKTYFSGIFSSFFFTVNLIADEAALVLK